jgi:hypothetical protein
LKKLGLIILILCLTCILISGCQKFTVPQAKQPVQESTEFQTTATTWPPQLDELVAKQVSSINN